MLRLSNQILKEAKQTAQSGPYEGQDYWTFTIRFPCLNGFVDVTGWQYYPSTGEFGAPKIPRGKKRPPFTSAWIVGALHEDVKQQVQHHFVVLLGVCPEPWEETSQIEAKKVTVEDTTPKLLEGPASEQPLEEYRKRYEHWETVAGANGLRGEEAEAFIQKKMKGKKR